MSPLPSTACETVALLRGQSLPIEVPAGTSLHVERGHVLVHAAPVWLGARLSLPQHELRAGAVQVFEDGGWLLIDAMAASALSWRRPQPRPSILQRAFAALASALHRPRPAAGVRRRHAG